MKINKHAETGGINWTQVGEAKVILRSKHENMKGIQVKVENDI